MRFHVDQTPRARQRRVVRRRLGHVQVQESPQAQRIRDPPRNPPLRRQTLEVADEQQPEIPPRTQTRAAQPRRVEHRAQPLHKGIESGLLQNPVQPFEKGMSRARRKVRCGHPHRRRLSRRRLLAHCHAVKSTPLRRLRSTPSIDFSTMRRAVSSALIRYAFSAIACGRSPAGLGQASSRSLFAAGGPSA